MNYQKKIQLILKTKVEEKFYISNHLYCTTRFLIRLVKPECRSTVTISKRPYLNLLGLQVRFPSFGCVATGREINETRRNKEKNKSTIFMWFSLLNYAYGQRWCKSFTIKNGDYRVQDILLSTCFTCCTLLCLLLLLSCGKKVLFCLFRAWKLKTFHNIKISKFICLLLEITGNEARSLTVRICLIHICN